MAQIILFEDGIKNRNNFIEKNWMLMTYYCPTHGDSGLVKPIQLTKKEISKTFLKKGRSSKN